MPAVLHARIEQVFRDDPVGMTAGPGAKRPLKGKPVRLVVTMGMPALACRRVFGGHGTRHLRRPILRFAAMRPVRETRIGRVGPLSPARRKDRIDRMRPVALRDAG